MIEASSKLLKAMWAPVPTPIKRPVRVVLIKLQRLPNWLSVKARRIWPFLPEGIRRLFRFVGSRRSLGLGLFDRVPATELIARRYAQIVSGNAKSIRGFEIELASKADAEEMIRLALLAQQRELYSDLVTFLESFRYHFPSPPSDPFSFAYRDFWLAQYEILAQKRYEVANEHHDFDIESLLARPHPYNTRDQRVIGAHVVAAGTILGCIPKSPPARILEMGVGFGNTALQMGLSGYDVTVLDIEKKHLEIVSQRFKREGLSVRCLHQEFLDIEALDERFDAIVFYECFHHCIDHQRLLIALRKKLTEGGAIIFAGETINEALPYAWGLNPTGQGIWSIRHHGWMELVFKKSYFLELLTRHGFAVEENSNPASAQSWVFTARPIREFASSQPPG